MLSFNLKNGYGALAMKNNLFLTDPYNTTQPSHNPTKVRNKFFDYKERVEEALIHMGIPFETARVAVIDLRRDLVKYHKDKKRPVEAAIHIKDNVRRIYKIAPPLLD